MSKKLMKVIKMQGKIIPELDMKKSKDTICRFIKDKIFESKSNGLIIGLSGGIDSSVVAYLCAEAIDSDKILGLILPSKTTSNEDIKDAISVAENINIKF